MLHSDPCSLVRLSHLPYVGMPPPLNEVALGQVFLPRADLLIPHLGSFWDRVKSDYPKCAHAPPVGSAAGRDFEVLNELPLPRVWFLSLDGSCLVQLQRDRLISNWRSVPNGSPYSGFEQLKAEHQRIWAALQDHVLDLTETALTATGYALTYVNIINRGDGWTTPGDQSRLFPSLGWHAGTGRLPAPELHTWSVAFPLPDAPGSATASVQAAKRVQTSEQVLRFEINVESGQLPTDGLSVADWADRAHSFARRLFEGLTDPMLHTQAWNLDWTGAQANAR